MSKLIVVSNRVATPQQGGQAGGLATALREALEEKGGIWCGWSGKIREYPGQLLQTQGDIQYLTMDMTKTDHEAFYLGFSNSLIWPLFHYRMGLTHYTQEMFDGYQRVNARFAKAVAQHAKAEDTVWVHDYHLLTLAGHLRSEGVTCPIGFFLHIPFPVPEVLTALPVHQEIMKAMCAYDVVGFQTENDLQSFLRYIVDIGGGKVLAREKNNHIVELHAFGRRFKAGCFPISIDTEEMVSIAELAETSPQTLDLKKSLHGHDLIIGVDRLDYTKGLPERLEAFGNFLTAYPHCHAKVSYLQITPPSRTDVEEYRDLRDDVERIAARINGTHADIDWVPIRYLNKSFTREQLAGFYRLAKVGLVTPLRDGMNLVAKEYVASQDMKDPGVLILSQFAGAAQELDAALVVNPYNPQAMSKAIAQALTMPLPERRERYVAMMKVLRRNDIFAWSKAFLELLTPSDGTIWVDMPPHAYKKATTATHPSSMV